MDPRTQERVEQWDSRPFSGGYDGLADLAAADFSGAVSGAGTWLFMLNGRIVGVIDGAIEDFESASGTVYEAPHPSLPLLCTMEERGGETRAKYYTNETPLREVDGTLQNGSFTGYIELSENVLSGDYYAVYYGGRRMAAAYIGNADRLLTGDEAFERADDEVGIYEVTDVEIDVTDVPGTGESDEQSAESDDGSGVETERETETKTETETGTASPSTSTDTGTRAEPSVDPTESALESIDISGDEPDPSGDGVTTDAPIEDVTIESTASSETDGQDRNGQSGITTTDDVGTEPASSGITDAGSTAESDTESASSADERATAGEATGESATDGSEPATGDETAVTDSDSTARKPETSNETAEPTAESAVADEITADETDTENVEGSGPDPAEVEAAAEQLGQNDISWTADGAHPQDETNSRSDKPDASAESVPQRDSQATGSDRPERAAQPDPDESEGENEERFQEEEQWRETRRIPSIDPDHSETVESERNGSAVAAEQGRQRSKNATESAADSSAGSTSTQERSTQTRQTNSSNRSQRQQDARQAEQADSDARSGSATTDDADSSQRSDKRVAELAQRIETLETQRDELVAAAEELEAERDRLRSENEELTATVDRYQSRIEELERELERARESGDDGGSGTQSQTLDASRQLSPQQALADTNLFVRYLSKSQPTLETAHDGEADRNEVASNLRLEHHTGFDAADVAVNGEPYDAFLTETMEFRFVDWLTEMVLYEIRDTGNAGALTDLYDAIPRIDRAELDATISLEDDDTDEVPDHVSFDVVAFDKMGDPLVVANLNDSREPASQTMLEEMEEAASAVKANYPELAAAIAVTSSYFEPGALEVTEQATSSGFLSRGSKLSYVNLSRKQGYHLCLVESRSEGFHMNVPEL
ncbi:transcriptional regulator [Natronorubrum sp. JWXQ-INN-674]|uniref:Transcriptional regulator n=1 Tax=Natronorubrum halalkaliphilum TaxID=2691917 RepID=A0A6B0VRR3_9EURY|nr:transcriptional regulator [Natronorubrum halalkaliphilum]MXV64035.1 transcriptional regulator [Natronorubrum halalkaliphilum]